MHACYFTKMGGVVMQRAELDQREEVRRLKAEFCTNRFDKQASRHILQTHPKPASVDAQHILCFQRV